MASNSLLNFLDALFVQGDLERPKTSHFGEMPTVSRTPLIELASVFPISVYRDNVILSGTASVSKSASGSEYQLALSGASDAATLQSTERGRYKPGYSANIGIGVRLPVKPSGAQKAIWGYFDTTNGMYFGANSSGLFIAYLNAGAETLIAQANWNVDRMDGTGSSGLTLDVTRGNIFQITFSWYGYGVIEYQAIVADATFTQRVFTVHRFSPSGQTSIAIPNLPVGAAISNAGTSAAFNLFVGGRQFSIIGLYKPNERTTSASVISKATTTTRLPALTFQRSATASLYVPCRLSGIDGIVGGDSIIEVVMNGTLTGASYVAVSGISSPETVLQQDTAASAITGGNIVFATLMSASGNGNKSSGESSMMGLSLDVPALQPISVCVRTLSGTSTCSLVARMTEDW